MRALSIGMLVLVLTLAGCRQNLAEHIDETKSSAEKDAIKLMAVQLRTAASMAGMGGAPGGFDNYVSIRSDLSGCRGPEGETVPCAISMSQFGTQPGRQCQRSARQIICRGAFRYYDPVVFTFNQGAIDVQATPKPGASPL